MAITAKDFAALQSGVNSISEGRDNKTLQILKDYLSGQRTKSDLETANSYVEDNAKKGRKVSAKVGDVTLGQSETDPVAKVAGQGAKFNALAQTSYKPIKDQIDSARATLDSLNQQNAAADKLALINEARLAAGAGGSRAIKSIMDSLTGGKTAASSFQDTVNYFQNTPNIPTMQPAQRDAIRESVFGRLPQVEEQHRQAVSQLQQLGPATAPLSDYNSIINAHASPIASNLENLKKMQADYNTQRKGAKNPISTPSSSNPNPTTLDKILYPVDKLIAFFGGGQSQPAQQLAPQAKTPVKKFYSASQNKTKVQYNDGTEEVVDGQQ